MEPSRISFIWFALLLLCLSVGCSRRGRSDLPDSLPPPQAETVQEVRNTVASLLGLDRSQIDPGKQLTHFSIGADDLDVVEIIMELEDKFQITIPDEMICDPKTGTVDVTAERLAAIVDRLRSERQKR